MLTTETIEAALNLYEGGSTHHAVEQATGITREEAEAVANAYDAGETEQLYREVALAGILELAAAGLRSGQGWDEGTLGDVLNEIGHVYHPARITPQSVSANQGKTSGQK